MRAQTVASRDIDFPLAARVTEIRPVYPPATAAMDESYDWIATCVLDDGVEVRFRHVRPEDAELIAEAIRTASEETILHRFFRLIQGVPLPQLREMLTIDRSQEACIAGEMQQAGARRIVCGARYIRTANSERAEIAVTVHDDVQHQGLGTFLLRTLTDLARREGVRESEAWILPSNVAMLGLMKKLFPGHRRQLEGDVYRITASLDGTG